MLFTKGSFYVYKNFIHENNFDLYASIFTKPDIFKNK